MKCSFAKFTEKEFRGISRKYRKERVMSSDENGTALSFTVIEIHPNAFRHGAHKNDRGKDRAEAFDHELEDGFPLERVARPR